MKRPVIAPGMSILDNIAMGFSVAVTPENFLYCLAGAFLGTLVGVFPGLGPVTTIAMLLPFTFKLPAVAALIMLSGIYYGAHHAGSTTADHAEHAGRADLGGDLHRRPPHGAPGPRRAGTVHCRAVARSLPAASR